MTDGNISNNLMLSSGLSKSIRDIPIEIITAAEEMAIRIIKENSPEIDLLRQENIDLIVRPLALTLVSNEMILMTLFSETTIEGIHKSTEIPDITKARMLTVFAKANGIGIVGTSPGDIYSQIKFSLSARDTNLLDTISNIANTEGTGLHSLSILDSNSPEMARNKISYVQGNASKAMYFSRSNIENGTLLDGGYSRADRLHYDAVKKASKIEIPGFVDVLFTSPIEEVLYSATRDPLDGMYHLPSGYNIDVESQESKNMVILLDDRMIDGITKFSPIIHVDNGLETESFKITRMTDPLFEQYISRDKLEISDLIFRGKYPLLLDLTLLTRVDIDEQKAKDCINKYLALNGGNMSKISPSEIMNELSLLGIKAIVSPQSTGRLYFSTGKPTIQNVLFPLSVKDLSIPEEIMSSSISDNTVGVFLNKLTIEID